MAKSPQGPNGRPEVPKAAQAAAVLIVLVLLGSCIMVCDRSKPKDSGPSRADPEEQAAITAATKYLSADLETRDSRAESFDWPSTTVHWTNAERTKAIVRGKVAVKTKIGFGQYPVQTRNYSAEMFQFQGRWVCDQWRFVTD